MKKIIITGLLLCIVGFYLSAESTAHPTNKNAILRGKKIYNANCLSCHQHNGSGVQDMNPPLRKSPFVTGSTTKLIKILLNGLNDGVEINGDTYSNPMPVFGTVLKDQQIADVLTYIRNSFGNKASTVYASQVRKVRLQQ